MKMRTRIEHGSIGTQSVETNMKLLHGCPRVRYSLFMLFTQRYLYRKQDKRGGVAARPERRQKGGGALGVAREDRL